MISRRNCARFGALFGVFLFLVVALLLYSFLWGSLEAFSPVMRGFQHQDSERARLHFHAGADLSLFRKIDDVIERVEAAHGLHFTRRVDVLVCDSDAEHKRLAHTGARFCALPGYGRLSVSKRAQEDAKAGRIHLDVYLAHELSHSLLFQNTSLLRGALLPDWFLEGLAVYSAKQRGVDGYNTRGEVRERIREGHFLRPSDFVVKPWTTTKAYQAFELPNKYLFLYAEMACFIEDLIQTSGEEKFQRLEHGLLEGRNGSACFAAVYGQPLAVYEDGFRQRMLAGNPAEGASPSNQR